jgi:hypothetical protein
MKRRSRLACFASFLSCLGGGVRAAGHEQKPATVGAVLEARDEQGRPLRFRIDAVAPDADDRDGEIFLYTVSFQPATAKNGSWRPYCSPDKKGRRTAIPLAGSWDASGAWSAGDGALTFACTSGAIGKCVRFGYKPWKTVEGRSLADYHAACVRMIRADYCGDGRPHTRNGTWVDIYDTLGIQSRVPDETARAVLLEAGWSPQGATHLNRPRWSDDAAAIAAECPAKLGGHVTASGGRPLTADEIRARRPDTLLFNDRLVKQEIGELK